MNRPARLALLVALSGLGACGPQSGARFAPMGPRTAVVGVELDMALEALGAGAVEFSYGSDLADLATRPLRPSLSAFDGGQAMFRWTPLASDVGDHTLRFTATANGVSTSITVPVTVEPGADPLAFVEPAGDGTTLDLARQPCADVEILVEDTGTDHVTLAPGATWNDNATLTADGPLSGTLHFCPSEAQAQAATIYPFSFTAEDDAGTRVEKRYTVVLGALKVPVPPPPPPGPNPPPPPVCDPVAPSITHKPHPNYTGTGNLHLYATVDDPTGVYDATAFWSTTPPADPANPDLAQMTAIDMLPTGGTINATDFAATIPSPVAGAPSGTAVTIYYLLRATDDDDSVAGCPYHTTYSPDGGVYSFVVKAP